VPGEQSRLTVLALATSGPTPERGRIVRVAALHVVDGESIERFSATVNPLQRVPRYVAARLGLQRDLLDDLPPFESIVDELLTFLGERPIAAQDARLAWAFLSTAARRVGRALVEPVLIDVNDLASRVLGQTSKPTLGLVAARLGISTGRIGQPEEEARVLAVVAPRLLALAASQQVEIAATSTATSARALRRSTTASALPDEPGVYVMRDEQQTALYVGKARRLRSRVAAYVDRPLGATRRLEGLVGTVDVVDPTLCATDLEALILEDREIRRLQPRFNTVRQQRLPRLWIRLPPVPAARPGKRQRAARRLEASLGPTHADGEFVGPFRNEMAGEVARLLARRAFDLDTLRGGDPATYEARLREAWTFLHGHRDDAERLARAQSSQLLRQVVAFDVDQLLLPADPYHARYAVVRPTEDGCEAFLLDRGIFAAHGATDHELHAMDLARVVLEEHGPPRSAPTDLAVVLRWLGAQRPPARLVWLADDDPQGALDHLEDAIASSVADQLEAAVFSTRGDRLAEA
jgi:DNA polymerase III epsilon subunit-like protein